MLLSFKKIQSGSYVIFVTITPSPEFSNLKMGHPQPLFDERPSTDVA